MTDVSATLALLETLHAADRSVMDRVRAALPSIAQAAAAIADRLERGGRWISVGAGTSGRLAALDAAELPPTFGIDASRVTAIVAGGEAALLTAKERAEDDSADGAERLRAIGLSAGDFVLGVAASGTTPFVRGALEFARATKTGTGALVCAENTPIAALAGHPIVIPTGPEVIHGSTRLKAGSAQKLALHLLSTATMDRLGLVFAGEMVAMRPTNAKLRERAIGIVERVTAASRSDAQCALETSDWNLPVALVRCRFGGTVDDARARLAAVNGGVARLLGPSTGSPR